MAKKCNPVKVSILGLDGAGKSTTVSYFVQSFHKDFYIIKLGRSAYYYDRHTGERVYIFKKLLSKIDSLYEKGEKKGNRLKILFASIFYVFAARYMEYKVVHKFKPDIMIASRDISVDTIIYSDYYLPFLKIVPNFIKRFLINLLSLFPKKSDLIIYLDLEPSASIKRIKKREVKRKIDRSVMRIKSRYRHENIKDLTRIALKFDSYLKGYLSNKKTPSVVYVDVNNKNSKEVTEFCAKIIKSYINKKCI
jgi:thymidylate kinase